MEDWCRHYTGLMDKQCTVKIAYESIRSPRTNDPSHIPYHCANPNAQVKCAKHEPYTQDEIDERNRILENFLSSLNTFWVRETEGCPQCKQHVDSCEQVGRCVYARPCGCRVGQGQLHENWKSD